MELDGSLESVQSVVRETATHVVGELPERREVRQHPLHGVIVAWSSSEREPHFDTLASKQYADAER
jgi:hypothetical protein